MEVITAYHCVKEMGAHLIVHFADGLKEKVKAADVLRPNEYMQDNRQIPTYMDICFIKLNRARGFQANIGNIANGWADPYMVDLVRPSGFCTKAFPLYLFKITLTDFNSNICAKEFKNESKICTQMNLDIK